MSTLFNELTRILDSGIKGLFENTLEFFSSEPLIDWLTKQSTTGLTVISNTLERVAMIRRLISKKEKEDLTQDLLLNSLNILSGKSRPNTFNELAKLKSELNAFYRNPKIPHYLKILSKFDLSSLRDTDKTINALITLRSFPRDAQGNFYIPSVKEAINAEKERIEKRKEERKIKRMIRQLGETDRKIKAASFGRLKGELLQQIEREPYRNSSFDFNEPTPGCHFDIGESRGYVLVPIPIPERHIEEEKGMEDTVDMERDAEPRLNLEQFLEFVHETTYNISEQLFDNLDKVLEIQVITVTQWVVIGGDEPITNQDYIHNTKYQQITARNNIFPACDAIIEALEKQYNMHQNSSNSQFKKAYVMKLEYRINRSTQKKERSRKYKGGSYINHFDIPCFTNNIRTNCITRMNNYNINKESTYIYNIVNPNDNLCFLRYIILIKFLSIAGQRTYLNNFIIPQILPLVNPENLNAFVPYIPFVRYPNDTANQFSEEIIKRHFPGLKHDEALTKVKLDMTSREYINDCIKLMQ